MTLVASPNKVLKETPEKFLSFTQDVRCGDTSEDLVKKTAFEGVPRSSPIIAGLEYVRHSFNIKG